MADKKITKKTNKSLDKNTVKKTKSIKKSTGKKPIAKKPLNKAKSSTLKTVKNITKKKSPIIKKENSAIKKENAKSPSRKKTDTNSSVINDKNTGSPEFQITTLTKSINNLTEHLKTNIHDHHSRHGLLLQVGRRRGLLDYLKNVEIERYRTIIKELHIRK